MENMSELTRAQRRQAADALEEVLAQILAGEVEASPGQTAYVGGALAGLRAQVDLPAEQKM